MYLLGSQEVADLISRDTARPIAGWLRATQPGPNELFVSVISLGQVAHMIETLDQPDRDNWRRLLARGRQTLAGNMVPVDMRVVDVWASSLRGLELLDDDPVSGDRFEVGEDDRLVIATAIERGYSLVTRRTPVLDEVAARTTLTIVEP